MLLAWIACLAAAPVSQGFRHASRASCGGHLTGQSGELNSSGFGPENDCVWLINKEGSVRVELTLLFLNVRQTLDCSTDYLEVIDGPRLNGTVLMRVCGSHLPENSTVASLASAMTVRLKSNERDHDNSFRASYTSVAKMPADTPTSQVVRRTKRADFLNPVCDKEHIVTDLNGTLSYQFDYSTKGKNCTWTLKTNRSNHHFVLNSAEIKGGNEVDCENNPHAIVWEGSGPEPDSKPLATICDRGEKAIASKTTSLTISLVSPENGAGGNFHTKYSVHKNPGSTYDKNTEANSTIIIAVASVLGIIVTAAGGGVWWRKRRVKKQKRREFIGVYVDEPMDAYSPIEMASRLPYDESFEIGMGHVNVGKIIGEGAFGVVRQAEMHGVVPGEPLITVAVKTACTMNENAKKALVSELKILVHLGQHLNIVNLVGANTRDLERIVLIVEYCSHGNLQDYLKERTDFIDEIDVATGAFHPSRDLSSSEKHRDCCTSDLFRYAYQAARGMEYLTSRNIIHGDLAARNVLLADENIVKICDFGLSKIAQQNLDSNSDDESILLPVKWMALESLRYGTFSKESDVWSYGVFVWELFSLAQPPYQEVRLVDDLRSRLEAGYRLEIPRYATNNVFDMMTDCWQADPPKRPSFTELAETLSPMINEADHLLYTQKNGLYVDMNKARRSKSGYYDYLQMFSAAASYTLSKVPEYVNSSASENV